MKTIVKNALVGLLVFVGIALLTSLGLLQSFVEALEFLQTKLSSWFSG